MLKQRTFNIVLLFIFLPMWMVCFGLSLNSSLRHIGYPPVFIDAAEKNDYPVLTGFTSSAIEKKSLLRPGDRLLRLGEIDLRGIGPLDFIIHISEVSGAERSITLVFMRGSQKKTTTFTIDSYMMFLPRLPAALVFMITALILQLRAKPSLMVRVFVKTHVCVAFLFVCTFAGNWILTYISMVVHLISLTLCAPLAMQSALLFPHGEPPQSKWAKIGPWLFAIIGPLDTSRTGSFPFPREIGALGLPVLALMLFVSILAIMTQTYRKSNPIGRRQLKWYLFGVYCSFALPMAASTMAVFVPYLAQLVVISASALAFIPIFLLISIMRYNFFDIDRLISATASYTIISIIVLAALLTAVPTFARAVSGKIGSEHMTVQIVLSVLLAVVVVPAHRRLRPQIEKIFFAERYALDQEIEKLLADLSACRNAEQMTFLVGEQLDVLIRPESCTIYALGIQIFSPVFVRGKAIPPAFEVKSPLIASLAGRSTALAAESLSKGRKAPDLSPFDRAALETLGVPVVLPIRRGDALVAFVCLGPKRSGDVYTSTDLALLTSVADKVSTQLISFDQAEVIRQSRAMQDALRRYVPGALVDHLESGKKLTVGECEVTVLFVDIKGYSSYAEGRKAAEVFSNVNKYTKTVSEIVRKQGGNIVEFNGDGMMAVFGAPQGLQQKEQAAVKAGCEFVPAVSALELYGSERDRSTLSIGIGIATGEAFVGNIQAVDRLIWSAIGSTTNLAARLQAMTRELDVAIVIDENTWRRAGDMARIFQKRENTQIRGLTKPTDVYVLPHELLTDNSEQSVNRSSGDINRMS